MRHWTGTVTGAWSLNDGTRLGLPWDRIDVGLCWEWQGARSSLGYGQMAIDGSMKYVHRIVWELLVGEIPEGLEPDHLCTNPPCCNPDHLELVTHAENIRRSKERGK